MCLCKYQNTLRLHTVVENQSLVALDLSRRDCCCHKVSVFSGHTGLSHWKFIYTVLFYLLQAQIVTQT